MYASVHLWHVEISKKQLGYLFLLQVKQMSQALERQPAFDAR